ncbi:tetratricopeptide repeat protein [Paenibacillus mucilaginosus]|uniref:Tetratricopeptide TPR_2 repeat protein n=1 Tax=Paenibacillus mucilaginosus (strain KNP414) TaxID=1036673 RepID=F8FDA9_PAEMK|nr:tetratricopeptide repeat protein [Paenibacillus mucilaginosus]AEI41769.1 Tetratricopeptide TPR_2 repeat protein [Paenibacillus mucilaginosus KNP414]MCG7214456.1 tetratricopeptide repeat protein [Paenibacillus mucilaginosus]WDM30739.1 tetratricopeptide repeat protein [Paenibacillus mucilaginosus]
MTSNDENSCRFSESPLWELQRTYYEEQGIRAWQDGQVPYYITNNPMIASVYAGILFGFLQDRAAQGHLTEPVTVLELGAGSGRLAFHVLHELERLQADAGLPLPRLRYVLSDFAPGSIAFWREHPGLRPWVEAGVLDFALFDAVKDGELLLELSGERIGPGKLVQPLVALANYFFDSIPQELLYIGDGNVYECRVDLQLPESALAESAAEQLLRAEPSYAYDRAPQYEEASYPYAEVIRTYRQELEDSHILFPAAGLACLERLGRLSGEGMVLLTADKGDHRLEPWIFEVPPRIVRHGSFSLTANYHAIRQVYEGRGALCLFPGHHYRNLNVGCILSLPNAAAHIQTRLAYLRSVDRFGPDDYFSLKLGYEERLSLLEMQELLAFWRLGVYDAEWFLRGAGRMKELLPETSDEEQEDLRLGIRRMSEGYYTMHPDEKRKLAALSAGLLFEMGAYTEALGYYLEVLSDEAGTGETGEADPGLLHAAAVCCYETGEEAAALEWARRAAAADPEHEEAWSLLKLLEADGAG